jgi:Rho termination factor, N-terminal domain
MPKGKSHGPSIKDDRLYERLREEGESKEKAARIANEAAREGRSAVGRRGGTSGAYEDWNVDDLRKKAADVGIEGRSKMNKRELVSALRNH